MDFVKSYWRILFALAISVVIAVRAYVGVEVLTVTDLAKAMGVALAALVGLHLAESLDLSVKFRQSRDDLRDDLSRVINAADRYATRIVEFKGQSDYDDLFDGLTGDLYSYNPHQFSDKTLLLREESIVESMRKRYAESAFT